MKWKTHPWFNNYEVSTCGQVRRLSTGRLLKQGRTVGHGYHAVTLSQKNETFYVYRHRMVAETFIEGHSKDDRVVFINGDKDNYNLENLISKKTRSSVKDLQSMSQIAISAQSRRNSEVAKDCGETYSFVKSALLDMGKGSGWKSRQCRIIVSGLVATEGRIKRRGFPNIIPGFNKSLVRSTIKELISDGVLKESGEHLIINGTSK